MRKLAHTLFGGLAPLAIAIIAVGAMSFASSANATGDESLFSITIDGSTVTFGEGVAGFTGTAGESYAEKFGSTFLNLDMQAGGGLCDGLDCAGADGGLNAGAAEQLKLSSFGTSDEAGTPAGSGNAGMLGGGITASMPGLDLGLQVETGVSGSGNAGFSGQHGDADTTTVGYTDLIGGLSVDGVCPTCSDGHWNLAAYAGEESAASAWAGSSDPGRAASVFNVLQTSVGLDFTVGNPDVVDIGLDN